MDIDEKEIPFNILSLDLPLMPIFKDKSAKLTIPSVSIFELLSKFDGENFYQIL